jgi:hypothetical protein
LSVSKVTFSLGHVAPHMILPISLLTILFHPALPAATHSAHHC